MPFLIVVDDEPVAADALRQLLVLDGHRVLAFTSSTLALEALEREAFDAVITDLEMPAVHGVEIVRAARKARPQAPVLVVSAFGSSPASRSALDAGACVVLAKPLDFDVLAAELTRALDPLARGV